MLSGLKPRYDVCPDSARTEPVEVPDLQSVGQQTCSDYLLSIPNCSTHRRDAKRKKLGGWAEGQMRG